MSTKVLTKGIQAIAVLFAAFGGFLVGIAPPQTPDARFAVGLSSFLALIVLFMISGLSKRKGGKKRWWLGAAAVFSVIVVIAGFYYKTTFDALVFEFPPGSIHAEHIAGTELTSDAKQYRRENPGISNSQLLFDFGGLQNKEKVWPAEAIGNARNKLMVTYVLLVLAIASAIFALTEGVLVQLRTNKTKITKEHPPAAIRS